MIELPQFFVEIGFKWADISQSVLALLSEHRWYYSAPHKNSQVRDAVGVVVNNASIVVTFGGQTFSGQTDSNGQVRTDWLKLSRGRYEAELAELPPAGSS